MFPNRKPKSDTERFLEAFEKQVGASPKEFLKRQLALRQDEQKVKESYDLLARELAKKTHSSALAYDEVLRESQPCRRAPAANGNVPVCARCGARMIKRTGQTGARKGQTYWGCSNYPACRYTKKDGGNEQL